MDFNYGDYREYLEKIRGMKPHPVKQYSLGARKFCELYDSFTTENVLMYINSKKAAMTQLSYMKALADYFKFKQIITSELQSEIKNLKARNKYVPQKARAKKDRKNWIVQRQQWDEVILKTKGVYRFIAWIGLHYGLRIDETLHLTKDDIDLEEMIIRITPKADWTPKSAAGIRTVPIKDSHKSRFSDYMRRLKTDYLCVNKRGGQMKYATVWETLIKIHITVDGIDRHLTTHTFRRSALTELYLSCKNLFFVSRIAGHSSPDQTAKYIGISDDQIMGDMRKAINSVL